MRRAAARSQCANNLRTIGLGLHGAEEASAKNTGENGPRFPAGTIGNASLGAAKRLSWLVAVLPHIEQENLYARFELGAAWDSPANLSHSQSEVPVYRCPDWQGEYPQATAFHTPFVGIAGIGKDAAALPPGGPRIGMFGYDRAVRRDDVKDGISMTLMVLESSRDNGPWAQGGSSTIRGLVPAEQPYLGVGRAFGGTHFAENSLFGKGRSLGCNGLMVDGSVRFLSENTAPSVLEALATIAGGERVRLDE